MKLVLWLSFLLLGTSACTGLIPAKTQVTPGAQSTISRACADIVVLSWVHNKADPNIPACINSKTAQFIIAAGVKVDQNLMLGATAYTGEVSFMGQDGNMFVYAAKVTDPPHPEAEDVLIVWVDPQGLVVDWNSGAPTIG